MTKQDTKKAYKRSDEFCGKCSAPMVVNPKTQKKFCSKKCWVKKRGLND